MIRRTARSLGETLWEEGQPQPSSDPGPAPGTMGGFCDDPSQCGTLQCVDFGDHSICTQPCDASSACPDGWACSGGYCARAVAPTPAAADAGVAPTADPGASGTSSKGCSTSGGAAALSPGLLVGLVALVSARRRARA